MDERVRGPGAAGDRRCNVASVTIGLLGVSIAGPLEDIRKSAESGDAAAQFEFGLAYFKGQSVPQNRLIDELQISGWEIEHKPSGHAGFIGPDQDGP